MPFRFREADGTVEAGVRRIACEQIDEALVAIRSGELASERIVHEVRRRCKAVRALIRLVRPVFPAFAGEDAIFREIGRILASARDGTVLIDTLEALTAEPDDKIDPRMIRLLRKRLAPPDKARSLRQALGQCDEKFVAARARAMKWTIDADGWNALAPGFANTLKAARHAMKDLARSGDPACSHEWRKRVKQHWFHLRLLRGVSSGPAEERAKLVMKLGDVLGERHDLDQFVEMLAAQPRRSSDAVTIERLTALARRRAAKLESRARKMGKDLFDDKPRKLTDKWGERWEGRTRQEALV